MKPDSDGSEYVKFDAPVPTELQLSDGSGCSDDSANSDQTVTNERCYDKTPEYVYGKSVVQKSLLLICGRHTKFCTVEFKIFILF